METGDVNRPDDKDLIIIALLRRFAPDGARFGMEDFLAAKQFIVGRMMERGGLGYTITVHDIALISADTATTPKDGDGITRRLGHPDYAGRVVESDPPSAKAEGEGAPVDAAAHVLSSYAQSLEHAPIGFGGSKDDLAKRAEAIRTVLAALSTAPQVPAVAGEAVALRILDGWGENWIIAKGKLTDAEPPYGAQLLVDDLVVSQGEGQTLLAAVEAAFYGGDVDRPTPTADQSGPALTVDEAWQELSEVGDRTSPEEYPDMCLITHDELADFMGRAKPADQSGVIGALVEAKRLALEDADALDRTAEDADENSWQDWGATMRQAATRIRTLAAHAARVIRSDDEPVAYLRDAHEGAADECLVPAAKGDPGAFPVYR